MNDKAASATVENAPPRSFLDRNFRLAERGTSLSQEAIAGATTFAAVT
jgi:adenine/guanine/hypoxanthine permease